MWHLHCFRMGLISCGLAVLGVLEIMGVGPGPGASPGLGPGPGPSPAASLANTLLSQPSTSSSHCPSRRTEVKSSQLQLRQSRTEPRGFFFSPLTSWNSSRKERSYSPLQCCSMRCSMSLCKMEVTASELTHSSSCSLELKKIMKHVQGF